MLKINKIKSSAEFQIDVERIMNSGDNMVDAIVAYCEMNNIEVEHAAALIKNLPKMKKKLKKEAKILKMVR